MAIATINPATGTTERTFTAHDHAEVERRLARSEQSFHQLRQTSFAQRSAWMRNAARAVSAEKEALAQLVTREMGKPIKQSRAEIDKCVRVMEFYAQHAERFLSGTDLDDPSVVGASQARTRYEPMGVVLAVMPWNFPFWQVIRFAAPALMAGNAGLLKHASNVPQCALRLDSLFADAGFPDGSFQSLLVGADAVADVVRDRRVAAVTLTGSEPAGRSIAEVAGSVLKKTVLELGGSDPFVVLPSADVGTAAETAVTARMINSGQSCVAAKRFIVHENVYDEFVRVFLDRMASLVVGDPSDEAVDVGPLATSSGRRDLEELLADAADRGATIHRTSDPVPSGGWFIAPTVVEGVTADMRLFHEEAFGPLATMFRARDLDHVIELANATRFGLSSSAWTADPAEAARLTRELEAGAVFVNGMTVSYPELPFGGVKDSGIGRELAAEGIREFCHVKSVWVA